MTHETYVSGGLCKRPFRRDALDGLTELLLYNPADQPAIVTMTVYFEQRPPHRFAPFELAAETNMVLVAPDMDRAVFEDCGFWGARFESTTPLVAVLIALAGELGNPCTEPMFKGGATHFLGTDLHTTWHFADGLWSDWAHAHDGDRRQAPRPFNELEYYYFLNPGSRDASVQMTLQYRNLAHTTAELTIPGGRVATWCNFQQVPSNQPYAVSLRSSEPITTTSVRYIYSLNGFDDWGMNIHRAMAAEPGPIIT